MAVIAPARKLAFDILRLVEGGGYAADLVYHRSTALETRDAGLAAEIVLGVLRRQNQFTADVPSVASALPVICRLSPVRQGTPARAG